MGYVIRELSFDQIFSQGVEILKNHFKLFLIIELCLYFPLNIAFGLFLNFFVSIPKPPFNMDGADFYNLIITITVAAFFFIPLFMLFFSLAQAAITKAVAEVYLGRSITPKEAIRFSFKNLIPIGYTLLLGSVFILLGLICFILPAFYLALGFSILLDIVIVEDLHGMAAVRRSLALMKGNKLKWLLISLVIVIVSNIVAASAVLIPVEILSIVFSAFINGVMMILLFIINVLFYFSCRCKAESFDVNALSEVFGDDDDLKLPDIKM